MEVKEINTGKTLEEIKGSRGSYRVVFVECLKPTKTLTKGKTYRALLFENKSRCNVLWEYTKDFNLLGLFNDTGHYVEVSDKRFKTIINK